MKGRVNDKFVISIFLDGGGGPRGPGAVAGAGHGGGEKGVERASIGYPQQAGPRSEGRIYDDTDRACQLLSAVGLVVTAERAFEVPDAVAQALAQSRDAGAAEEHYDDESDDQDLAETETAEHGFLLRMSQRPL
jgi:hypothetical protein